MPSVVFKIKRMFQGACAGTARAALLLCVTGTCLADDDGFYASLESRFRYETLDGQFRQGSSGGDQILAIRSLLKSGYQADAIDWHFEFHDARTYLDDAGTPLSRSFVNTFELLQAYASIDMGNADKARTQSSLRLGRFSLDIASRRFVERNSFRNTINAYTGAHWISAFSNGAQLDAFYVIPVDKRPSERSELDDNAYAFDENSDTRRFWGLHLHEMPVAADLHADLFVYGLNEQDDGRSATADRKVYAPGFRLRKAKAQASWDFELEGAYRLGHRSESSAADAEELDVRAYMLHAELGYTFSGRWSPRIAIEYDLASGDKANDNRYTRYERFYGTRRGDLGNTSIHGPLTRSNASVPGVRFSFNNGRTDGRVVWQHARLHSSKDAWVVARLADPSGRSGSFIGNTLDFRIRHWLRPRQIRVELGGSILRKGQFALNAPGAPEGDDTYYAYTQVIFHLR